MPQCIYCGEATTSEEHWLPRAFGVVEGMTLLKDRICRACNAELGRLDQELARTGPTGFRRDVLGITGRASNTKGAGPFYYRASEPVPPTTLRMPDPSGEYQVLAEPIPDGEQPKNARAIRQLVFRTASGEIECIPFPRAWDGRILKTAIEKRGLQDAALIEVYLDEDEDPQTTDARRTITDALGGNFVAKAWFGGDGDGEVKVQRTALQLGITRNYLRALAKVAFHYFLWTSRVCRGDEPEFEPVRRFILADEGSPEQFVEFPSPHFIPELADGKAPSHPCHILVADQDPSGIRVRLQLLIGPGFVVPPSTVRLGGNPCKVVAELSVGHYVVYRPDCAEGCQGELLPIEISNSRIIRL